MSLLKPPLPAYLLAPRHSVQAEEDAAMLKEFNHITRELLFLHGHLTRPADWAENAARDTTSGGRRVESGVAKRSPARRLATAAAACGIVTPLRFIAGQLR
jgi:hypothetical protein